MMQWPEFLRHAEDWASGFWTGAAAASLIAIAGAVMMLAVHAI